VPILYYFIEKQFVMENFRTIKTLQIATILAYIVAFIACGKTETETLPERGRDYYPLQIGKSITYTLDTVIYDPITKDVSKIDTFSWQMREVIVDTFRDKTGSLNYKIERYERRKGDTGSLKIAKVVSAAAYAEGAMRFENNLSFVKFPWHFAERTSWDGNVYNDPSATLIIQGELLQLFSKKWTYEVLSFDKAERIGNRDYPNVLTVRAQSDPRILTERRYTLEKYAKGVGLVYRELYILDTQKLDANAAWEVKAYSGIIVRQTAISVQ
jgi:hypothetical protein